jgi:hypothetical protein
MRNTINMVVDTAATLRFYLTNIDASIEHTIVQEFGGSTVWSAKGNWTDRFGHVCVEPVVVIEVVCTPESCDSHQHGRLAAWLRDFAKLYFQQNKNEQQLLVVLNDDSGVTRYTFNNPSFQGD